MPLNDVREASWVEKSSRACGGDPCIRETRHSIAGLVQWRRMGLVDDRILEMHPDLTSADLVAAWAYYDEHRDEVDRSVREDEDA